MKEKSVDRLQHLVCWYLHRRPRPDDPEMGPRAGSAR